MHLSPHRIVHRLSTACAVLTLGLLAAASAQARPDDRRHGPGAQGGPAHHQHGQPGKPGKPHQAHKAGRKGPHHGHAHAGGPPPHAPAHGLRRGAGPQHDWYRGGRVPPMYRTPHYVVSAWRGHHLAAPPRGYHWVQYGSDYLLIAVATGVIAQLVLGSR